jgi:hypothetical protein
MANFPERHIADERKKRSFLERRRAANDPYFWAIRHEQIARHMLFDDGSEDLQNIQDKLRDSMRRQQQIQCALFLDVAMSERRWYR